MSKKTYFANLARLRKPVGNNMKSAKADVTEKTRFPVNSDTMTSHNNPDDYHYALIPKKQTVQNPPRRKVTYLSHTPKLNLIKNGVVNVSTPYDTNQ
jgi:hypothetical protein